LPNYALTTDGRSTADVEKQLRKYLPGLDVRLWPYSATQAVIRQPLVRALETDYPHIGAGPLLKVLGVADIRPVSDEATIHLIENRDVDQLAPRETAVVVAPVPGFDWHLALVNVPAAWARLGGPDAIAWGDVKIGHIDTGYTEHPALGFPGATWVDVANARTFDPPLPAGEASMAWPAAAPGQDNLAGFSAGHGTRMASTMCGYAPAAAPGGAFYGVAPRVPLVPVRITGSVWITHAQRQFKDAVAHLIGGPDAKVINVSLGVFAGVAIGAMKSAVNDAYEAGVIMICAAGNYVNSVVAPARLQRTIAVGGVTFESKPWSGSSYGPEVDFSAPAADLRRASTQAVADYVYAAGGDGTSYATAITSGAAALWLAYHGAEKLRDTYPLPWQRVEAFRAIATQTTRQPPVWNLGAFGSGVLDVDALLAQPLPAGNTLTKASAN
jgi:hypothetical protein